MATKTNPVEGQVDKAFEGVEEITCYAFAKLWGEVVGKPIREQMVYNYRAKGMLKVNEAGRVTKESALEFLQKRVAK